ncbi:hypothetical protein [Pedomonas sp. V897]|uniref:hypothetical protein n=1 Tax=Pedomonas sp. V897 TaxID=3446482 RepID=UPI003EE07809
MTKAGAVGGAAPVQQPAGAHGTGAQGAGTRDTGSAGHASALAPSPAAAPETAGRPATSSGAEPAVALAATLAGLKVGQELRGALRFPPALRPHAWLETPEGGFVVDPAPDLPAESELSVVLTRADRAIAALLVAVDGTALDPPRPVRLALVALPDRAVPPLPPENAPPSAAPPSAAPPLPPRAAPLPPMPPAPALEELPLPSLFPGDPLPLRGRGALAETPDLRPPTAPAANTSPGLSQSGPTPLAPGQSVRPGPGVGLPPVASGPIAGLAPGGETAAPLPADRAAAQALTILLDAPVLALRVESPGRPPAAAAVSVLAVAEPGEVTPLTQPAPESPLARLAANGRLVTAVVLPPDAPSPAAGNTGSGAAAAAPPAAPRAPGTSPAPATPISGGGAGSDGAPAQPAGAQGSPAPGAAFSTEAGGKTPELSSALPPVPESTAQTAAAGNATPLGVRAQVQEGNVRPHGPERDAGAQPGPAAPGAEPRQTMRLAAGGAVLTIDLPAHLPRPEPGTQLILLVTRGRDALLAATPTPHNTGVSAEGPARPAAPATPASASGADADAPEVAAPTSPALPPAPGVPMPGAGVTITPEAIRSPAAPLDPGEALVLAVMQALGRRGFDVTSHASMARTRGSLADVPVEANAALPPAPPPPARAADLVRAATAAPTIARGAADSAPDALPLVMTLQTPHGPMPLTMLVWQPVRREEEDAPGTRRDGAGQEVCFAVEVEFDALGPLRLRGRVTPRFLNLAVETEQPLDVALQRSATRDFTAAVEAGGMSGTLVFRHRLER